MAKYYIAGGDLRRIMSFSGTARNAAKIAVNEFVSENKDDPSKTITTSVGVSQRGFRDPEIKKSYPSDDAVYFEVMDIIEID
jgi:hypothetical protein